MKFALTKLRLNLIAGLIALGILAISAHTLRNDYLDTWQEAENSSRNLLTAIARDLGSDLDLLDLSLKGVIEGLRYIGFQRLPPDLQHRVLFDRVATASLMGSLVVVNEAGELIADAGPVIAPRSFNLADNESFVVHKANSYIGLYVSRPFKDPLRNGELSLGLSRRLSYSDGRFAGVVMGFLPLHTVNQLFNDLRLGKHGTINLFRGDGILLTRHPFDTSQINQNLGTSLQVQRLLHAPNGTLDSVSPIDQVRRIISFQRLDDQPLVLTVALSVDEFLAAWRVKAIVMSLMTGILCFAVVGLTVLFQRELKRRTKAETKLRRLARTDDLTGLLNRRGFREIFEREWRQAIRSGSSISLLYIDADYFKSFNDRYGHGKGDDVLRTIAHMLNANIQRPRDVSARHGGEEFAIVLPETDASGARMVAENIRQAIMALGIAHEGSPYHIVTVSIGVASARPPRGSMAAILFEAADTALYKAKAAGRNNVCGFETVTSG
ncbi:hypothetical protein C4E04_07120 [Microvirga sp. 17 mud 1-3]|nr:hypothetical protein C4E04_07120 [Microvirga sp. 17 mud 1-3]